MTFWSVPPSPGTTSWVIAGVVCSLAQTGSAAMLMTFILGGVPSSLIVPVTEPAVLGSTAVPPPAAGAPAAGCSLVVLELPPQLIIPTAKLIATAISTTGLAFITNQILL